MTILVELKLNKETKDMLSRAADEVSLEAFGVSAEAPAPDLAERLRKATLYEGHGELSALPEEAADEITRLTAEVERLASQVVEAEKYNGWHQQACLENEKLHKAVLKADRYLAMGSVSLARETLSAALKEPRHED